MNTDSFLLNVAFKNAIMPLYHKGFRVVGFWLFEKNNLVYDLSAADLSQIERIEKEGLFLK